jgi:hypothetical protein
VLLLLEIDLGKGGRSSVNEDKNGMNGKRREGGLTYQMLLDGWILIRFMSLDRRIGRRITLTFYIVRKAKRERTKTFH